MSPNFSLIPLDVHNTALALACQEINTLCQREFDPHYTPSSPATFLAGLRSERNWAINYIVAIENDTHKPIGWASISYSKIDPHDPIFITVTVAPTARRQGVGSALNQAILALCPSALPAKQFFTEFYLPSHTDPHTHPVTQWAKKNGWKLNEIDYTFRLPWPADAKRLTQLMPKLPTGYEIRTYKNGVPAELCASLGVLRGQMDAAAPSGEIEFTTTAWSTEYYHNYVAYLQKRRCTLIETVAVFAGEVVGFTTVEVPENSQQVMNVRGTGVLQNHRGKRLGLALKIQIALDLLALQVENPAIETDTAMDNPWMLNINRTVGFQEFCQLVGYIQNR